jgi:hypothetical protein
VSLLPTVSLTNVANVNNPLLALATLGSVTQVGSFLLGKASKEGDIAGVIMLNFANGNTA